MRTAAKDKKYLGRDIPPTPIEVVKAKDSFLYDRGGKEYIDFVTGWNVGNIGWGNKEIENSTQKFTGPNYVNPYYLYKPWAELAETLTRITPIKSAKVYRATGGTEAVEIALQAAMAHTKRNEFISFAESYHGHSIGTMSLGLAEFYQRFKINCPKSHKIKPPFDENKAKKIVKKLSSNKIAAFISEPIVCNLGVEIPTKKFFDIVFKACKEHGTVFIMDEVATGFGRTGKMFASEHYNLKPDIMCLGKGLTGGYSALAATVISDKIAKSFTFPFSFYSTFGWHPLNVHLTLAYLKYFLKHKEKILKNTNQIGNYFESRLNKMNMPPETKVNIKGLTIGIRFKQEGYGSSLTQKCLKRGLLISEFDNHFINMFPALTLNQKVAKQGLDILESCL